MSPVSKNAASSRAEPTVQRAPIGFIPASATSATIFRSARSGVTYTMSGLPNSPVAGS